MSDERWNDLQWSGRPGHYEVYYVTFTDPPTGVGFWIRYTMVAPLAETGEDPSCSLWFMAMDPADPSRNIGEKVSFPTSELSAQTSPFRLVVGPATLTDGGMAGSGKGSVVAVWLFQQQCRLGAQLRRPDRGERCQGQNKRLKPDSG